MVIFWLRLERAKWEKESKKLDSTEVDRIIDKYKSKQAALISILQDIQAEYNYLPGDVLTYVAKKANLPLSRVCSVASFFASFSLKPRGRHLINVCLGTACHVKGGEKILERIEKELNIKTNETTEDLQFTAGAVRCLGCCSLGPVMRINEHIYGRLTQEKISKILNKYKGNRKNK